MLTERQLDKLWYLEEFDSPKAEKTIMAEMPNYDVYLVAKSKLKPNGFMDTEPVLKKKQEYHLFRQYNYLKYKCKLAIEAGKPSPEWMLARIKEVRRILVCANTKAVITVLKHQKFKDRDAAISDGYYGLIDAVDLFDYRKDFKFITYAYLAIQSKIRHFAKLQMVEEMFAPNNQEITLSKVTNDPLLDIIYNNEEHNVISDLLRFMSPRERQIITHYFDLDGHGKLGLLAISRQLKVNKQRVAQIKNEGLKKIKKALAKRMPREYRLYEEKRRSAESAISKLPSA